MITINDNSTNQINAAILRLNNNFTSANLELKNKLSSDVGRLELKIDEIKAGTLVYTAGSNISISSTGVISVTGLSTVATSGSYTDLTDKPTIPAPQVNADWNATSGLAEILNKPTIPAAQVQSDWTEADTSSKAYIQNKPALATVATSGSYNDLTDTPTIPTVNDSTITINANGAYVDSFTLNQSSDKTINIPTGSTFTGYTFTYIVDSNQKLSDWANNVSGNDYTSVLIKPGTWSITNKNINLDTTGTKVIVGESGSLLECLNVSTATFNTAHNGFLRSSKTNTDIGTNPDSDRYIFGVNVRVTYMSGSANIDGAFYGFYGLCNLHSCTGTVVGASSYSHSKTCAFGFCFYMYDCKGYVSSGRQYNSTYYQCRYMYSCYAETQNARPWGYESCYNLTNCSGFWSGPSSYSNATIFRSCYYLDGCFVTGRITSTISTNTIYGFYGCDWITNCSVNINRSATGVVYGIGNSMECSNCSVILDIDSGATVSSTRTGITNCAQLVNCTSDAHSGSGTARGFNSCVKVSQCRGRGRSDSGSGYGFSNCNAMTYCSPLSSASTTTLFNSCYSSTTTNATYAAADTLNGGWNTATYS